MRTYLLLRLYRLTLLLGTSGAIVTALASENIQARGAVVILLPKVSALGISAAFAVMDFSASGHWNGQAADNRVINLPPKTVFIAWCVIERKWPVTATIRFADVGKQPVGYTTHDRVFRPDSSDAGIEAPRRRHHEPTC